MKHDVISHLNETKENSPVLGTRFAITATSATLLANLVPLIVGMMLGTLFKLLVAAAEVKDVIRGSDDVSPCGKLLDVAFVEGFVSVLSDEEAAKNDDVFW